MTGRLVRLIDVACRGRGLRGMNTLIFTTLVFIRIIEGQLLGLLSVTLLHIGRLVQMMNVWSFFFFNLHQRLVVVSLMAQLRLNEVLDASCLQWEFTLL